MPPIRKILRERLHLSSSLPLSRRWGMAYKALAAATVVLLFGAVFQEVGHDGAGAQLLFKLGLGAQVAAMTCFVLASYITRGR
jgi:hypothetical protein